MTFVDIRKLYKPNGYLPILVITINMAFGILAIWDVWPAKMWELNEYSITHQIHRIISGQQNGTVIKNSNEGQIINYPLFVWWGTYFKSSENQVVPHPLD